MRRMISEERNRPKDIYVLTHEKERTDRIADNADVNTIGIKRRGLGQALLMSFKNGRSVKK